MPLKEDGPGEKRLLLGAFWVPFSRAVWPLLGAGDFPSRSHPQLEQGAGDSWFHLLLDVDDTVGGDVCGASFCAVPSGPLSKI